MLTLNFIAFRVAFRTTNANEGLNEVQRANPFLLSCLPHESFRFPAFRVDFGDQSGKISTVEKVAAKRFPLFYSRPFILAPFLDHPQHLSRKARSIRGFLPP